MTKPWNSLTIHHAMAPEMVRPGGVHLQNPWQINSKNDAQIKFLATRACLFEILGAFLSALILDTLFIGHPPPKKRQSRETVLQNWSLFASSGAFELAPFFLKTRQGRKGLIFGAPGASRNRSKIDKNEGRGKPWNSSPKSIDFWSLSVGPEPRNTLAG